MSTYLLAARTRKLLPQVIIGMGVRKMTNTTTVETMNTVERPGPSIQSDNVTLEQSRQVRQYPNRFRGPQDGRWRIDMR